MQAGAAQVSPRETHLGHTLAVLHDLGGHRIETGRVGLRHHPGPRAQRVPRQPLLLLHKARYRIPGLAQAPTPQCQSSLKHGFLHVGQDCPAAVKECGCCHALVCSAAACAVHRWMVRRQYWRWKAAIVTDQQAV